MKKYFNSTKGFTLIELLIVIAILGILATAVLSAINPIEQINRGRDTGTQSDAEQLLSAIQRFNASQGYFPWQTGAADEIVSTGWTKVTGDAVVAPGGWTIDNGGVSKVLDKLGSIAGGTQELQTAFITRITSEGHRGLWVYNGGVQGNSTYVCFKPQSGSFLQTTQKRWLANCAGVPEDLDNDPVTVCDSTDHSNDYSCLP